MREHRNLIKTIPSCNSCHFHNRCSGSELRSDCIVFLRERLLSVEEYNNDLESQVIGLKLLIEEFVVRFDFMLKCNASVEACLLDLRDLEGQLYGLLRSVDTVKIQENTEDIFLENTTHIRFDRPIIQETQKKTASGTSAGRLGNDSGADEVIAKLESSLSSLRFELEGKSALIDDLKSNHKQEILRLERRKADDTRRLRTALASANDIINRWKRIYKDDMLLRSRGCEKRRQVRYRQCSPNE
jgi:hypothetical protein